MAKCLYCYKELNEGEKDFHKACSKKIFGTQSVPELPYTRDNLTELAKQVLCSQTTLTGVQAKLSLDINKSGENRTDRFTVVGLWGQYILKPQTDRFVHLPELEDLTMHLAELAKLQVVPHSLIRSPDGELCYITRRIDRTATGDKLPMEDMCQLTERLTEHKYKGSYEQIAKAIQRFSSVPKLDMVNYWEQVVFSWITGNADMHMKNFSLYSKELQEKRVHHKPGLLPPFYADMPKTLDEIEASEMRYLTMCEEKGTLTTDFIYFWRIFHTIVFKRARSH